MYGDVQTFGHNHKLSADSISSFFPFPMGFHDVNHITPETCAVAYPANFQCQPTNALIIPVRASGLIFATNFTHSFFRHISPFPPLADNQRFERTGRSPLSLSVKQKLPSLCYRYQVLLGYNFHS
jgi:hypothetical protein